MLKKCVAFIHQPRRVYFLDENGRLMIPLDVLVRIRREGNHERNDVPQQRFQHIHRGGLDEMLVPMGRPNVLAPQGGILKRPFCLAVSIGFILVLLMCGILVLMALLVDCLESGQEKGPDGVCRFPNTTTEAP